jgi:hypothetical protein
MGVEVTSTPTGPVENVVLTTAYRTETYNCYMERRWKIKVKQ